MTRRNRKERIGLLSTLKSRAKRTREPSSSERRRTENNGGTSTTLMHTSPLTQTSDLRE
jgi:hypothetical protein